MPASAPKHFLYVNLSASQARKRLKGHGYGVRRVEAVDRNQSVIVHTATGQHLRELQGLFSGLLMSPPSATPDPPVASLRNLGPASAARLQVIGVRTQSELQRMGAVAAYRRVQQLFPDTSLNLLWALEGALHDRDWRDLDERDKQRLRQKLDSGE